MKEYSNEIDVEFVRKSVRTISKIALKLPDAADKCVYVLVELMKTKVNYVVQEAVIVCRELFRKYPSKYELVIKIICENLESLDDSNAKSAMIWILGEYCENIDGVDKLFESFILNFEEESPETQLTLLTSVVKYYLKTNIGLDLLSKLLKLSTEEVSAPDLRDRAFIYWRLITEDLQLAKKVVLGDKIEIDASEEKLPNDIRLKLIKNIGHISSLLFQDPDTLITNNEYKVFNSEDDEDEMIDDN